MSSKLGRPQSSKAKSKVEIITFRVLARERRVLEEMARKDGLKLSDRLRNVLFCTATNPLVALGLISIIKEVERT